MTPSCLSDLKHTPIISFEDRNCFAWPNYSSLNSRLMLKKVQEFIGRCSVLRDTFYVNSDWLQIFPNDWGPIKVSLENTNYWSFVTVKMHLLTPSLIWSWDSNDMKTFSTAYFRNIIATFGICLEVFPLDLSAQNLYGDTLGLWQIVSKRIKK